MQVLLLTNRTDGGKALLPALELLDHALAAARLDPVDTAVPGACDVVLVDATSELAAAAQTCRAVAAGDSGVPVVVVLSEGGLAALKHSWGFDDWLLADAPPSEVETRLRLAVDRQSVRHRGGPASIGGLSIDEIGEAMSLSRSTVKRDLRFGRAWLAFCHSSKPCPGYHMSTKPHSKSPTTDVTIRKDQRSDLGPVLTLLNGAGYANAATAIDFNNYARLLSQRTKRNW